MTEQGNALFLILIAVALFAALSYAVTQSGRGGGTIDKEQSMLNSAQIVQHTGSIRNAVMRMTLTGTDVASLRFNSGVNTPCSAGENCVFAPEGGGVVWKDSAAEGIWQLSTVNFKVDGVGTATNDYLMQIPSLSQNTCEAINGAIGLSNNPVASNSGAWFIFDAYSGEEEACFQRTCCASPYLYYQVLEAR